MCWIEDCDPWSVYRQTYRVARREHKCHECGRTIYRGERYHYATGLHSDWKQWDVFKLCLHCDAASGWLVEICSGFLYGGIQEELEEHWWGEPELRSYGLARLIVNGKRKWRTKKGDLVEVPSWAGEVARTTMAPIRAAKKAARPVHNLAGEVRVVKIDWRV